jgi:hypothetical protein
MSTRGVLSAKLNSRMDASKAKIEASVKKYKAR